MGEVYRARDTRLERTVAIKVLPEHLSNNPQLRERFDREAKAISSLSHPHICALHDVGHQDGVDFLVMEFLEGETLAPTTGAGSSNCQSTSKERAGAITRSLKAKVPATRIVYWRSHECPCRNPAASSGGDHHAGPVGRPRTGALMREMPPQ